MQICTPLARYKRQRFAGVAAGCLAGTAVVDLPALLVAVSVAEVAEFVTTAELLAIDDGFVAVPLEPFTALLAACLDDAVKSMPALDGRDTAEFAVFDEFA